MTLERVSGVRTSMPAILRRLSANGHDELHLTFAPDQDQDQDLAPDQVLEAVRMAMRRANNAVDGDSMAAETVEPSFTGPLVVLDRIGTKQEMRLWLTTFATSLQEAGYSGVVKPSPEATWPRHVYDIQSLPRMTAYLGYTLDEPLTLSHPAVNPPFGWAVDTATTHDLCRDLVTWSSFPGASTYLRQGRSQVLLSNSDVSATLAQTVGHVVGAGVTYVQPVPLHVRRMQLARWGQVVLQIEDEHLAWHERLAAITQPLLLHPDKLDLAFIRLTPNWANSWTDLGSENPALPHVSPTTVRRSRHLWNRYIPDVHGIQILTQHHLNAVHHLDAWNVRPVTANRYLVEARDLEPWYGTDKPDPGVLTQARSDFTDLLLTPDILKAHPRL